MRRLVACGGRHNRNAGVLRAVVVGAGALVGRSTITVGRINVIVLDGISEDFREWAVQKAVREGTM